MNTKDLPKEIAKVKEDIIKRLQQFNRDTGISISGLMSEALYAEEFNGEKLVKSYQIGVSIEL